MAVVCDYDHSEWQHVKRKKNKTDRSGSCFLPLAVIQLWCGTVENFLWIAGMFSAMGVMTILLKYGCLIKWKMLLTCV